MTLSEIASRIVLLSIRSVESMLRMRHRASFQ